MNEGTPPPEAIQTGHVFSSLWIGDCISPYESLCLKSFVDQGHVFRLYAYNSNLNVPPKVELRNAREIIGDVEPFAYKFGPAAGSYALFSNIFRYKLLSTKGGWWVDTDVICLSNKIPHFKEFFAHESEDLIGTAILYFPAGSPVMLTCLDIAEAVGRDATWGEIGPELLTSVLRQQNKLADAQDPSACYPVPWTQALDVLSPETTQTLETVAAPAYFLHLWNEILRRQQIAKTSLPPRGSFLRQLIIEHHIEGWHGEYSWDMLAQHLNNLVTHRRQLDQAQVEIQQSKAELEQARTEISRLKAALVGPGGKHPSTESGARIASQG